MENLSIGEFYSGPGGLGMGAKLAKIKIFATGGIGGVHRGGEDSLDISADLQELAKSNVTVVCSCSFALRSCI